MTEGTFELPGEHPVSVAMRATVRGVLRDIEREQGVTVLFACESGSRGWGFASPDSDYDVRFVYVRRPRDYLTLDPVRDVIERPISGELDVGGWDLRKALQLLRDSNPTLLEWLRSPIVYEQDDEAAARLRTLAAARFSLVRGYHHYVSMAKKNLREHLYGDEVRLKKYLYVLRPLLAARWIRERGSAPPMVFADLARHTLREPGVQAELVALLAAKMRSGEARTGPRRAALHEFIERELAVAQAAAVRDDPKPDGRELDAFLHDTVLRFAPRPGA
ncbi:MAG TPA: nucleotidyltransferase domain-containing protein [Burkholderiaceae bacterium]